MPDFHPEEHAPRVDSRFAAFKLSVRESAIHRWGVYAEENIPRGRKVIEYTGERISRRETKRRGTGSVTYLFTLDDYWTIDGAVGGSGAEYINHSCDPNCGIRPWPKRRWSASPMTLRGKIFMPM